MARDNKNPKGTYSVTCSSLSKLIPANGVFTLGREDTPKIIPEYKTTGNQNLRNFNVTDFLFFNFYSTSPNTLQLGLQGMSAQQSKARSRQKYFIFGGKAEVEPYEAQTCNVVKFLSVVGFVFGFEE